MDPFQFIGRNLLADEVETILSVDATMYYWLTWSGALVAFVMAFGIGANDVANTFGTSVGAKSLNLWQACFIAGIMEFLGCLLMGKNVTDTVRKGIVDPAAFAEEPQVLMLGMFCALVGAGTWLLIATHWSMPVSTTHSIIGAILGFGLCYGDAYNTIDTMKVGLVVMSWIASPVLAGIFAAGSYLLVRWAVLRRQDSLKAAYLFYPVFLFVMFLVMSLFIIVKGSPRYGLKKMDIGVAIGISIGIAAGLALLAYFLIFKCIIQPKIDNYDEAQAAKNWEVAYKAGEGTNDPNRKKPRANSIEIEQVGDDVTAAIPKEPNSEVEEPTSKEVAIDVNAKDEELDTSCKSKMYAIWKMYIDPLEMDKKVHKEIGGKSADINADAEVFHPKTELVFSGIQIATASFDTFAHGANDTANAIGPLAAIIGVYSCGCIEKKTETPLWVIFLGATGLVVGLCLLGWRVIRAMGLKLVRVTPARGFTMELSSAVTVIIASKLGIPVSTTHCQIGAEIGVGLLEGCKKGKYCAGVNWGLFGKIFLSWVFTLIFAGGVTALLFSICLYSPFAPENAKGLIVTETIIAASAE